MARGKWEKQGEIYLKMPGSQQVASDGVEVCLNAKMIPPFVQPRQYWINVKLCGSTAVGIAPASVASYRLRGFNVGVPMRQLQIETDDVTMTEMMARFATEEANQYFEPDDTPSTDVGIDGDTPQISDASASMRFLEHRAVLGLPDKAVFSDANLIHFVDQWSRKGHIAKNKEVDEAGLIGIGIGQDDVTAQLDHGNIMWGDNSNIEGLMEAVLGMLPPFEDVSQAFGSATYPETNWLREGYVEDTNTVGQTLRVWTRLTLRCDVYSAKQNRVISLG